MSRRKADTKKSPDGQSLANQNTKIINIIWRYFIRYGKSTMKFNSKNRFEQSKNEKSSTLP